MIPLIAQLSIAFAALTNQAVDQPLMAGLPKVGVVNTPEIVADETVKYYGEVYQTEEEAIIKCNLSLTQAKNRIITIKGVVVLVEYPCKKQFDTPQYVNVSGRISFISTGLMQ